MNKVSTLSKFLNSRNPPTLASDREHSKDTVKDYIHRVCKPHFEKVLKEIPSSSGGKKMLFIRPHNFVSVLPLISDFLVVFKPLKETQVLKRNFDWKIELIPHGHRDKPSWHSIKLTHFMGHKVIVTTKQVWIYWHEPSQYRIIDNLNPYEKVKILEEEFKNKMLSIYDKLQKDFKIKVDKNKWGEFRKYGKKDKELSWGWHRMEIEIIGTESQKNLPKDLYWESENTKKKYDKGFEVKNLPSLANTIENDALRRLSPDIANAINGLGSLFTRFSSDLNKYNENIEMHLNVMTDIKDAIKELRDLFKIRNGNLNE